MSLPQRTTKRSVASSAQRALASTYLLKNRPIKVSPRWLYRIILAWYSTAIKNNSDQYRLSSSIVPLPHRREYHLVISIIPIIRLKSESSITLPIQVTQKSLFVSARAAGILILRELLFQLDLCVVGERTYERHDRFTHPARCAVVYAGFRADTLLFEAPAAEDAVEVGHYTEMLVFGVGKQKGGEHGLGEG